MHRSGSQRIKESNSQQQAVATSSDEQESRVIMTQQYAPKCNHKADTMLPRSVLHCRTVAMCEAARTLGKGEQGHHHYGTLT